MYTENLNKVFFDELKSAVDKDGNLLYPGLSLITVSDNILHYGGADLSLGSLNLNLLNKDLYKLKADEIYFAMLCYVSNSNNPDFLDRKIKFMDMLIGQSFIDDEQTNYIYTYIDEYYKRYALMQSYKDDALTKELLAMSEPLKKVYDKKEYRAYHSKPASVYVRNLNLQNKVDVSEFNVGNRGFMSTNMLIALVVILSILLIGLIYFLFM